MAMSAPSTSSATALGKTIPRIFTPPLRPLTRETSLGFLVIDFANRVLRMELMPWQEWWLIHALELMPDSSFRFRTIVTLVARQNGKTTLLKVLALFFMYYRGNKAVLGTAQTIDIARESWDGCLEMIDDIEFLRGELVKTRRQNGEQEFRLLNKSRYKIAASTGKAGRGLSIDLLIMDELREQKTWDAWAALSKTTLAKHDAITVCISNAGDDESVVLNTLQANGQTGTDETLAIFEWSAPYECDIADPEMWRYANPALGYTITERVIKSALATDSPAVFRTEVLCQHVSSMADSVVSPGAWDSCGDQNMILDVHAAPTALCVDVGMNLEHCTLAAAQLGADGRVKVGIVAAWKTTTEMLRDLPGIKAKIKPVSCGWFPGGPAAGVSTELKKLGLDEIKAGDTSPVCQEFAELIINRGMIHNSDGLLSAHILGAKKWNVGDGWRFVRRGTGHVDAAYAAAGAAHLIRNAPPKKKVMLITPRPRP